MNGSKVQVKMKILVIDDDLNICQTIQKFFQARGHRVFVAHSGVEGLELLRREAIDVVITDYQMPEMNGLEVIEQVKEIAPEAETVMVTGYGDMDRAIQAMRAGAFDFFNKPLNIPALAATLERTARFYTLRKEKNRYRDRLKDIGEEGRKRYGLSAIVGESPAIREVKAQIMAVGQVDVTAVLICGETGTGKELVARAIHFESSRPDGPFVAVDCTSISAGLVESELFGHVKGAFTDAGDARKGRFERADGGTLFLNEIGDMPSEMQAKLLRVLEERCITPVGGSEEVPVDVRVVSATNRDLAQAVFEGTFREDLLYRLNTVAIRIQPLRERVEDILLLARHFFARYARETRKSVEGFTPEAEMLLQNHPFPGNARELRNLVEQAVIFCRDRLIGPDDLKFQAVIEALQPEKSVVATAVASDRVFLERKGLPDVAGFSDLNLEALEKATIQEALRRCEGNQHHAADLLGITRFTLRRRLERYGIE